MVNTFVATLEVGLLVFRIWAFFAKFAEFFDVMIIGAQANTENMIIPLTVKLIIRLASINII